MRALGAVLLAALVWCAPAAGAERVLELPAGGGTRLIVETAPFRYALVGPDGRETIASLDRGAPVRVPGADGPQPAEPLGALGGFPPLAWVTGVRTGTTIPVFLWAGNRLFGTETGALVTVTAAGRATRRGRSATVPLETVAGPAELRVDRLPGGGVRLRAAPPTGVPAAAVMFSLESPAGEGLYGLGARKDAFDQRGLLRNVWVEQQNAGDERVEPVTGPDYTFPNGAQAAYFVQPALLGSRGWAAWTGGSALGRLDLAASAPDAVRWGVAQPQLDLRLAAGGLGRASRAYTADAGRAPAPPRHVYRPWIDVINEGEGEAAPNGYGFSGGARVRRELEEIAAKRDELGIPIGVVGVEGWHAVPGAKALFASLRRRGIRVAGYWNPFIAPGTGAHAEASRLGVFIRDPLGNPFPVLTSRNTVVNVVDFTHPQAAAFWRRQITRGAEIGIETFMHDFGEFVTDGMTFHDGSPAELAHNRYPDLYHRAAREAADALRSRHLKPWFYVRSGFTGTTAATSGVFPGDETTDWARASGLPSVVPAMLNLALTGAYTFTTDVGGYFDFLAPRTTPELLRRWTQLAALTPVLRVHNSTAKQSLYPWEAGPETVDVFRRYSRLKVRLIGLVDRLSRRAARTGAIGPVRPLVLADPRLRSVEDQWLLGPRLLVAPVLDPGVIEREVRLPAGSRWQRVTVGFAGRIRATDDVRRGGRTVRAPAPAGDIPIFLRVRRCPVRPGRAFDPSARDGGPRRQRCP